MRGQLDKTYPAPLRLRIIPARAGPTRPPSTSRSLKPDHPRSCGANFTPVETGSTPAGSSPLVRGQPELVLDPVERVRIIPARAGPTEFADLPGLRPADHPRSCGANFLRTTCAVNNDGSSPLVRGQRRRPHIGPIPGRIIPARAGPTASWIVSNLPPRIIPARAGPTLATPVSKRSRTDHPRSCGANVVVEVE